MSVFRLEVEVVEKLVLVERMMHGESDTLAIQGRKAIVACQVCNQDQVMTD